MAKFCGKCGSSLDDHEKCPNCKPEKLFSMNTIKSKPWIAIIAIVLVLAIVIGTISIVSICFQKDDPTANDLQLPIVGKFTDKKITDGQSAIQAVQEVADDLGLENAADELTVKREDTVGELTYYRLQQNYKGIPVYGSDFIVITDENGEAKGVTGNTHDIDESISLTPTVTQEQVEESIRAYVNEDEEIAFTALSQDMLYIYNEDLAHDQILIYVTYAIISGIPNKVLVNANTGEIIKMFPLAYTEDEIRDDEYAMVVINANSRDWKNWNTYAVSRKTDNNADRAEDLLKKAKITYDFYKSMGVYSFNCSDSETNKGTLSIVVDCSFTETVPTNAMANTDNATMSAAMICFGHENSRSLDTVAHEYTHIVENLISNMDYSGESGAIMEGYSDIFGELVEDFSVGEMDGSCDWIHGNRNMVNPSLGLDEVCYYERRGQKCPVYKKQNMHLFNSSYTFVAGESCWVKEAHPSKAGDAQFVAADASYDGGGVHWNSTVISHAAYLMTEDIIKGSALTTREVAELWYHTLYTLPSTCDFYTLRANMEMVAKSLDLSWEKQFQVSDSFNQVGIQAVQSNETYVVNPSLQVLFGKELKPYDNYTIQIEGTCLENPFVLGEYEETIFVRNTERVRLNLKVGVYTVSVSDNLNPSSVFSKEIRIVKRSNKNLEEYGDEIVIATNFGNSSNTDVPEATTSDERDIVLVLDNSGSMSGTPIQETRKASENFVKTVLQQDASIGIVAFESEAHMLSNFSMDEAQLMSALGNLYASGGTNTLAGLTMAGEMLEQSNAKKKIIVLMSDGRPSNSQSELAEYAKELRKKDIIIYSLGFFSDVSDKASAQSIMESIADEGRHYEVADADSLVYFFGDIADQISGQPYIFIKIACPVEVTVEYGGEVLCSETDNLSTRTSFGSLTFEERTDGERVKVLRLKQGTKYDIRIEGTDEGRMNYTIGLMDKNGEYSDIRKFYNVKITDKTLIKTVASESRNTVLEVDEDGDGKFDVQYKAGENSRGEIVKTNHAVWVIPSIILILIAVGALIVVKKKNILIKKG